jgi:hypothetical protein
MRKVLNVWEPGYEKSYEEPWFIGLDPASRRRIQEQDIDRAAAHSAIVKARTPEERIKAEHEFVALCRRQVTENMGGK